MVLNQQPKRVYLQMTTIAFEVVVPINVMIVEEFPKAPREELRVELGLPTVA
jgi:hypothetical protein